MIMRAMVLVLSLAVASLANSQQPTDNLCGVERSDWYVQAEEDEKAAEQAILAEAEHFEELEQSDSGESSVAAGWYTASGQPGSEVLSVSGAGYYAGNITTNGSIVQLSTADPCVVWNNTNGTNGQLLVTCYDRAGSYWHGLRYWFKPDVVATGQPRAPRMAVMSGDRPIVAYANGPNGVNVTHWPGPGSSIWRGLKSTTGPDSLPVAAAQVVDVAVQPGTGQPWFVVGNGYGVAVAKWNGSDYQIMDSAGGDGYAYWGAGQIGYVAAVRIAFDTLGRAHLVWSASSTTGQPAPVGHLVWNGSAWVGYQTTPDWLPLNSAGHLDVLVWGQSTVYVVAEYASNPYRDVSFTRWTAQGWKGFTGYPSDSIGWGDTYMPSLSYNLSTGKTDVMVFNDGGADQEIRAYRWDWDNQPPSSWGGYDGTTAEQVSYDNPELTNWFPAETQGGAGIARAVWTTCTAPSTNCVPSQVRFSIWHP